jgi:hypothetical protein
VRRSGRIEMAEMLERETAEWDPRSADRVVTIGGSYLRFGFKGAWLARARGISPN